MGLFKLQVNDFVKGAVVAAFTGFIFSAVGFFNQPGFDIFAADWNAILNSAINAAVAAFVGYIGKNFLTAENGKILGKI